MAIVDTEFVTFTVNVWKDSAPDRDASPEAVTQVLPAPPAPVHVLEVSAQAVKV